MAQVPSNLIPVRVSQLPDSPQASLDGYLLYMYQGTTYKIRAGDLVSVSGVPVTTQVLAGTGLTGGGQLTGNVTLSIAPGGVGSTELADSGVTPGVYGDASHIPQLTVDETGRVMAATSVAVSIGAGTVTSVAVSGGSTGLTTSGGPVTTSGTITLGGTLAVASGGTGATNATNARANLSAAASGANGDITSLSGVTGGISTADYIDFDTTAAPARATGRLWWDAADGNKTLSLGMEGTNATLQIGQETYYRVKASAAIAEGQVVMFTGTVGASGALKGAPATGLSADTAPYVMGVATEDIALNDWGYVTAFGLVRGINTTGGAEAWVDGQILFYDPTVTGGLTKNAPAAPNPKVQVAAVIHAASNGSLFVRPTYGGRLGQFEGDVQVTSVAANHFLVYDTDHWANQAPAGARAAMLPSYTGNGSKVLALNSGATDVEWVTAGSGTVSSVALTAPTGFAVSGSPVTTSGTLALSFATGYALPTTASQTNWDTAYTDRLKWDGGATGLVAATGRTSLGLGTAATMAGPSGAIVGTTDTQSLTNKTLGSGSTWNGGAVAADYGGTGQTTYSIGDILYASGTASLSKLSPGTNGYVLTSNGAGAAPSWAAAGGSMVYPGAGIAVSTGSAWGTSISVPTGVVKGNGTTLSAAVAGTDYLAPAAIGTTVQAYDADLAAIAALAGTTGLLKKTAADTWSLDTSTYLTANQSITISGDASGSGTTAITLTLATVPVSKGGTGATTLTGILKGNGTSAFTAATAGTDYVTPTGAETLTNKTLTDPAIIGAIMEDVYTISDGASVDIDPGNGTIQLWTLGASRTPTATNFAAGESVTLMINDGTAYAVTWTTIGVVWAGGSAPTLPTTGYGVIELWKVGTTVYGAYVGAVA